MIFRTTPETAAADRAAAGHSIDGRDVMRVRADEQARWHAHFKLSCGHEANDGLREDDRGRFGCPILNCSGLVVHR
jgi:hypothetical protein